MIGFLILHYRNDTDTAACVESILALDDAGPLRILVVDNASDNGSYERLTARYAANPRVTLVTTGQNLGFSAGNNFGWKNFPGREAVEQLVVCNSDVVFDQRDFAVRLTALASQTGFDVLGPDIMTTNGGHPHHTSPLCPVRAKKRTVQRGARVHALRVRLGQTTALTVRQLLRRYPSAADFAGYCAYALALRAWALRCQMALPRQQGAVLQGACLVFARRYLARYDKLFEPETFFYGEELLLWGKARRDGLCLLFEPDLRVLHCEGRATAGAAQDERSRFLFVQQQMLRAEQTILQTCLEQLL